MKKWAAITGVLLGVLAGCSLLSATHSASDVPRARQILVTNTTGHPVRVGFVQDWDNTYVTAIATGRDLAPGESWSMTAAPGDAFMLHGPVHADIEPSEPDRVTVNSDLVEILVVAGERARFEPVYRPRD